MPNADPSRNTWRIFAVIMVAVAVWGIYLALGAYLYKRNVWPPIVVLACFAAFLGSWILLLRRRDRAGASGRSGRR